MILYTHFRIYDVFCFTRLVGRKEERGMGALVSMALVDSSVSPSTLPHLEQTKSRMGWEPSERASEARPLVRSGVWPRILAHDEFTLHSSWFTVYVDFSSRSLMVSHSPHFLVGPLLVFSSTLIWQMKWSKFRYLRKFRWWQMYCIRNSIYIFHRVQQYTTPGTGQSGSCIATLKCCCYSPFFQPTIQLLSNYLQNY